MFVDEKMVSDEETGGQQSDTVPICHDTEMAAAEQGVNDPNSNDKGKAAVDESDQIEDLEINETSSGEQREDKSPKAKSSKYCYYYAKSKCKFGKLGIDCGFSHPEKCKKFMEFGWWGCKSADICQKFHPRVCNDSYRHMKCTKKKCDWPHIRNTRKPLSKRDEQRIENEDESNETTAPPRNGNNSQGRANPSNPSRNHNQNRTGGTGVHHARVGRTGERYQHNSRSGQANMPLSADRNQHRGSDDKRGYHSPDRLPRRGRAD